MFSYQKRLLFPVHVDYKDEKLARVLLEHFAGYDSELTAFMRLMHQRLQAENPYIRDLLGMLGSEELAHMEVIGTAIRKLGIDNLPLTDPKGSPWDVGYVEKEASSIELMRLNEEAENRMKKLYMKHVGMTSDSNVKKMLLFLSSREEVHQRLFKKAGILLSQNAGNEQFSALIHDYKMSLRIIK
ncbi:manganese catalase family protein [Dehalobacter sp. DCM]|uniref:manganese catalase family protein n=1 Tax=Dehalobacter sp. DCM TaxID=2907827 RepID=UPI0030812A2F|nr:manganese catalase family protein [Dehalobacter sp. DCM]